MTSSRLLRLPRRLVEGRETRGTGGTRGTWIAPRTAAITTTETCLRPRPRLLRGKETGTTSAAAAPAPLPTATAGTPLLDALLRLLSARGVGAPAVMDRTIGRTSNVFSPCIHLP